MGRVTDAVVRRGGARRRLTDLAEEASRMRFGRPSRQVHIGISCEALSARAPRTEQDREIAAFHHVIAVEVGRAGATRSEMGDGDRGDRGEVKRCRVGARKHAAPSAGGGGWVAPANDDDRPNASRRVAQRPDMEFSRWTGCCA